MKIWRKNISKNNEINEHGPGGLELELGAILNGVCGF